MFAWIRERLGRRTRAGATAVSARDLSDSDDAGETREALREEESQPGMPRIKTRNV